MKQTIRVLVADDHPVVLMGLQSRLARERDLEIVGEATDGEEALSKALALKPDVVLLDISMPRRDGLAVTIALRKEVPQTKVLILSVHDNEGYLFRMIQAGAHGYVSKGTSLNELLHAIRAVHRGETFFSPEIAQAALNQLVNHSGSKGSFEQLTPREREVLILIAGGRTSKEIASNLGIGVRTVETHRERIMSRLDIHSIAGLTKFAVINGLVTIEDGRALRIAISAGSA